MIKRFAYFAAALGLAAILAGCGQDSGGTGAPADVLPPGPHVVITIEAAADAHYQVLCEVRAYQDAVGNAANRYGIDKSGPFTDTIPSPNAHCHAKLLAGAPPLKFTLTKPGAAPVAAQITTPGDAGEIKFDMW